jgi:hypothetical protein
MIKEYLINKINIVIEQGMSKEELETLQDIAHDHHAILLVYRIEAHSDVRMTRLKERAERINQPVMSEETMNILSKIYNENEYVATATFDSGVLTTREMADRILKDLKKFV